MATKTLLYANDESTAFSISSIDSYTTRWECIAVDDGDDNHIYIADAGGNQQFTATVFTEPADSITNVILSHITKKAAGASPKLRDRIRYNNTNTQNGTNVTPTTSYVLYSTTYTTNQETAAVFTAPELNGAGLTGVQAVIYAANNFAGGDQINMTYGDMVVTYEYNNPPVADITSHADTVNGELQTNPTFTGTSGTITGPGSGTGEVADNWTVYCDTGSTGICRKASSGAQMILAIGASSTLRGFNASIVSGTLFKAEYQITNVSSGATIAWSIDNATGTATQASGTITGEGSNVLYILANTTDTVGFIFTANAGESFNIANASIKEVTDYEIVTSGVNINFTGTGTDIEDGALSGESLVWTSSIDGPLGTGTSINTDALSLGLHQIKLTVTDSGSKTDVDGILVRINDAPVAEITNPDNLDEFFYGADVSLQGTGTDTEDGSLSGASLVWDSDVDGALGTGSPLVVNDLTIGSHTITLTVTDSYDAEDTDSIDIVINNNPPVATITTPSDGSTKYQGNNVTFTGTGIDVEDGSLSGASLVWVSDLDGQIGTGTSFVKNDLSLGTHTITLTATDSATDTDEDSITVNVVEALAYVPSSRNMMMTLLM